MYNADATEMSGLDAITINESARTKWVYTKPLRTAASFQLKSILDLNTKTLNPHNEAGRSTVAKMYRAESIFSRSCWSY